MARIALVMLALVTVALVVAGCAGVQRLIAGDDVTPAASVGAGMETLAGHWQGSIWETGAHLYQGSTELDVRIADDGRWSGTVGKARAEGTARLTERGRLVLSGTAHEAGGHAAPVYLSLTGDESRRWGGTAAVFAGREANAQVSLQRVP
jgi:hypothetical protein